MIDNRTVGNRRKKRRYNLLASNGPFPNGHNILQFYSGGGRGELLRQLTRHVQNSDAPVVVSGESGSGKTLLSLVLADQLKKKFLVCRYDAPTLSRHAILCYLISELKAAPAISSAAQGRPASEDADAEQVDITTLASVIESSKRINQPVLLIIDSVDCIGAEFQGLMEELKQIKNDDYPLFSTVIFQRDCPPDKSPVQVPIPGTTLSSPQGDQLPEIPWPYKTYTLGRLTLPEIHDYLQHHMMLFDYNQRGMFTHEMSYFIADRSEGVYGLINEIARNAFLLAGINNSSQVSLSHLIAVSSPQPEGSDRVSGIRSFANSAVGFAILVSCIVVLGAALVVMSAN